MMPAHHVQAEENHRSGQQARDCPDRDTPADHRHPAQESPRERPDSLPRAQRWLKFDRPKSESGEDLLRGRGVWLLPDHVQGELLQCAIAHARRKLAQRPASRQSSGSKNGLSLRSWSVVSQTTGDRVPIMRDPSSVYAEEMRVPCATEKPSCAASTGPFAWTATGDSILEKPPRLCWPTRGRAH